MNKAILIEIEDILSEKWCIEIISAMKKTGHQIIFVTTRAFEKKAATISWMIEHEIPYGMLITSPYTGQTKKSDDVIRKEIYDSRLKDKFDVLFVITSKSVKSWQALGLPCLQACL